MATVGNSGELSRLDVDSDDRLFLSGKPDCGVFSWEL